MPVITIETQEKRRQSLTARGHRNWRERMTELIFLFALSVILLEMFFNVCGVGQQEFLQPDSVLGYRHIANKLVVWRLEGFSCDRLSSAGLRDVEHDIEKTSGTIRVALLGDSSSEGLQVPLACTYGRVLEKLLKDRQSTSVSLSSASIRMRNGIGGVNDGNAPRQNLSSVPPRPASHKFEVINFACAGYSTGQQLMQYRVDAAKYKPDIVLVLYNRGDAVENVLDQVARLTAQPRPYFYLDQHAKLKEDLSILTLNCSKLRPNPVVDFLRMHSRLYGVFSQTHLALSINDPRYRKITTWFAKLLVGTNDKGSAATKPVLYPKQDPLRVTIELLDALCAEAKSGGARLILVAFPNVARETEYAQQISELARLSYARQFPFIDLTRSFITHPEPSSLFVQYHLSSAGHQLVARQIYAAMRKELSAQTLRESRHMKFINCRKHPL